MDTFYPFIYQPKKKKEDETQPLYIEVEAPPLPKEEKKEEPEMPGVIIIELM